MTPRSPAPTATTAPLLVLASIVSVQFGGALAATLLPRVGVAGSVGLRLGVSAALLVAVTRPALHTRSRSDWATVVAYAAALTTMNLSFYAALERLPIGVAVTVEFIGPLVLSAAMSRSARDIVAVIAAAAGVLLVSGALEAGRPGATPLDPVGLAFALGAGAMWAAYIVTSGRAGARFAGLDALAIALLLGALVVVPAALLTAGSRLGEGSVLARGAGVAVLSSLVPYSLELLALRHLSARVFGVLLSLEPAVAALAGVVVLGQWLRWPQIAGMVLVVAASTVVMSGRPPAAAPDARTTPS